MFNDTFKTPVDIFSQLSGASYMFYLTGSRFFGTSTESSDWDFYAQDSLALNDWLFANGFVKIGRNTHNYKDLNCAKVYRYELGGLQVDIQLVINVWKKRRVQATLLTAGVIYPTPEMWNACYRLIDGLSD